MSKSDKGFEVEEITEKKIDEEGSMLYRVKWKDLPLEESTWEPIENFDDIRPIKEFEKRRKALECKAKEIKVKNEPIEESEEEVEDINVINSVKVEDKNDMQEDDKNQDKDKEKASNDNANDNDKANESNNNADPDFQLMNRKRKRDFQEAIEGNLEEDIPITIKTAKQDPQNENQIQCEIIWQKASNESTLANSWYSNEKLKSSYPLLLLEYYENHLKFPQQKKEVPL